MPKRAGGTPDGLVFSAPGCHDSAAGTILYPPSIGYLFLECDHTECGVELLTPPILSRTKSISEIGIAPLTPPPKYFLLPA